MTPRQPKRALGGFVVEPGVPIPTLRSGAFRYPFPAMTVGDSFLLKGDDGEDGARNAYRAARLWGSRQDPPRKFSIRRVSDGWRLWRTE